VDTERQPEIREQIKITQVEHLYEIKDKDGRIISYETANGRQLFNHYRHSMTNYDEVLNNLRAQQGRASAWYQKQASMGAAEQILEHYRDEHVKVIQDSQQKGSILKNLMQKAGVSTASALSNLLDSWSERIKEIGHLESSQRSLQTWNDTYRVQRELVKKVLETDGVSQETRERVDAIYAKRSSRKAIELGVELLDLEKSEILKLVKSAIRYAKNLPEDDS
jgi:hypothetical protein